MRKQITLFLRFEDLDFLGVFLDDEFKRLSKIFTDDSQENNQEFIENGWYFKIPTLPDNCPDWYKTLDDSVCTILETSGLGDFLIKFYENEIRVYGLV